MWCEACLEKVQRDSDLKDDGDEAEVWSLDARSRGIGLRSDE